MKTKLSIALLSKNSESHIANCLNSVKWADEIVVLDGHSSDRTREIAAQFGAKVLEKDFDSFPAQRQYVMEQCGNDWILSLDTDMIVPTTLANEIQALMERGPDCDAYLMRCLNHFLGKEIKHCSWFDFRFLRLFNRKSGSYDLNDKILDSFACRGEIGKLNNFLVHHQTESLEEYLQKMTRLFAPLTADEYISKGIKIRAWNMPWYFTIRPALIFLYKYFWKRGFMDGIPGFIICVNSAILYYLIFTIIWNRQKGKPTYHLEQYDYNP